MSDPVTQRFRRYIIYCAAFGALVSGLHTLDYPGLRGHFITTSPLLLLQRNGLRALTAPSIEASFDNVTAEEREELDGYGYGLFDAVGDDECCWRFSCRCGEY